MATAELTGDLRVNKGSPLLRQQLRILTRAATIVALLTAPAVFFTWSTLLHRFWLAFFLTIVTVLGFRGFVDVVTRRLIPWPSLYGASDARIQESDIVDRRRAWYWRRWFVRLIWLGVLLAIFVGIPLLVMSYYGWSINFKSPAVQAILFQMVVMVFTMPLLFLVNIVILFGPMLSVGISQIKGYEPGDADWGVQLDGRSRPGSSRRPRSAGSSSCGRRASSSGGRRQARARAALHGPPGTGKTMLPRPLRRASTRRS